MMTDEHIKEFISLRYIELVAAYNGFNTSGQDKDYGEDLSIIEVGYRNENGQKRFSSTGREIKIQLKATTINSIIDEDNVVKFDLEAKNFNDLIERKKSAYPLILVVFILPENKEDWVNISDKELIVKKCAYWYLPENNNIVTKNTSTKRIEINKENLLDIHTLPNLINNLF